MARETLKEFEDRYNECIANSGKDFNISYDYIYNVYFDRINPYKHLITKHQITNGITIDEICVSFGVSKNVFNACRYYFEELDMLVKHKRDVMKIKAEMTLQNALYLNPTNPKLVEMEQRLYNDEWKDKSSSLDLVLPETLKIEVYDDSMNEEDLEPYDPTKMDTEV